MLYPNPLEIFIIEFTNSHTDTAYRPKMDSYSRLSSDFSTLKSHYEIVVIGSGYGGGIMASRLARAGRQVCMLERGKGKHYSDKT
jgi:NADPH-dependent 2,4-dienoyl-CoA reductase/sulfur reductase-like enzyme